VLNELRLLSSSNFDSRNLLTVVLCGDQRLLAKLQDPELLPLASRIRVRLLVESQQPQELREHLTKAIAIDRRFRELTQVEPDFDPIRSDPRFVEATHLAC
jgi:type II secretory pathway predicted ATPase ExeA